MSISSCPEGKPARTTRFFDPGIQRPFLQKMHSPSLPLNWYSIHHSTKQQICPSCGSSSTFEESLYGRGYFRNLGQEHAPNPKPSDERYEFLTGYYEKFFREIQNLGTGSYGSVYLCKHVLQGVELGTFAVKKVALSDDPAWQRRVFREVKAFDHLHHPNIVSYNHTWVEMAQISDFGPTIPCLFLLMEYANSGNLGSFVTQFLEKNLELPEQDLWISLREICEGLAHLHSHGICHRDIKPANILLHVDQNPVTGRNHTRILISDFGQSEYLSSADRLPRTGYTGTMMYTAPELLQAQGEFDEKCDIFSLGCVLYALSYGNAPFESSTSIDDPSPLELYQHILNSEPYFPEVPSRSAEFVSLVSRMLHPTAGNRPSASEILRHPCVVNIFSQSQSSRSSPMPQTPNATSVVPRKSHQIGKVSPPLRPMQSSAALSRENKKRLPSIGYPSGSSRDAEHWDPIATSFSQTNHDGPWQGVKFGLLGAWSVKIAILWMFVPDSNVFLLTCLCALYCTLYSTSPYQHNALDIVVAFCHLCSTLLILLQPDLQNWQLLCATLTFAVECVLCMRQQ